MATYKGRWHGAPLRDFKTKKYYIQLEIDSPPGIYDDTREQEIAVTIETWREKRSRQANKYYYEIIGLMAAKMHTSKIEMHNMIMAQYGKEDENAQDIMLDFEIDWRKLESVHLTPRHYTVEAENGKLYSVYGVIRGSHTYNSKEMAELIDGAVREAREMGIETTPPEELERLREQWQQKK